MKPRSLLPACVALGLSACAPRTNPTAPVLASSNVSSVSFYPRETNLTWLYLPEGDPKDAIPYVLKNIGPLMFEGQAVLASQMTGRGADQTWYRVYDDKGVKLLGIRKPGVTVSLSPAWLELPPENAWQVGLRWAGTSQITVRSDDGKVQAQGTLKYQYDVQDQRQVTTPAGTFNVWVVTQQISDDVGGLFPAAQQYWFAPSIGLVRTAEQLLLTSKNFSIKGGGK